jgi:hypothetical protein
MNLLPLRTRRHRSIRFAFTSGNGNFAYSQFFRAEMRRGGAGGQGKPGYSLILS